MIAHWRAAALALAVVVVLSCTAPETARPVITASPVPPPAIAWLDLSTRPLRLPGPGPSCPVSKEKEYVAYPGGPTWLVLGDGPAYPVQRASLTHPGSSSYAGVDGRTYRKAIWLIDGSYQGALLVRGARLEDGSPMYFGDGAARPPTELRIDAHASVTGVATPSGPRDRPSSFSVAGPGCYGFQVDGVGFTKHIVFRIGP